MMFSGKILFRGIKKDLKWAPNEVFLVSSKINPYNFYYFLHEITVAERLKIHRNDFFGGKFCFQVFRPKGAQNEVSEVLRKVSALDFLNFCMKVQVVLNA